METTVTVKEIKPKYYFPERVVVTNRKCNVCGMKFYLGKDSQGYVYGSEPKARINSGPDNNACSNCQFWTEKVMIDRNEKDMFPVIINNQHYYRTSKDSGFNFGGQMFHIKYLDRPQDIVHCYLSGQGTIPVEFRNALPDNAEWVED